MTDPVQPPTNDDERDRHRFYAQMASAINANTSALERVFKVLGKIENKLDEFEKLQTEIQTTKRFAIGVYSLLLIVVGWIFVQSLSVVNRVDKLERLAEVYQLIFKPHEAIPDQVQALKSRVNSIEDQVTEIQRNHKK